RNREVIGRHDRMRVLDRGLPDEPSSTPLGAALPMLGGIEIEPVLGYNSFDVRRSKEYLQFITNRDEPLRPRVGVFGFPIVAPFPVRNKPLLDLLGTRYLLQPIPPGRETRAEKELRKHSRWARMDRNVQRAYGNLLAEVVKPHSGWRED